MSEHSSIISNISESYIDNINSCKAEFENILCLANDALTQLYTIRNKIIGPMVMYQGETKPISTWLTEWEGEMTCDKYHNVTWGQILLEKLEKAEDM